MRILRGGMTLGKKKTNPTLVELQDNGFDVSLTGQQVKFIRKALGDTQKSFAVRLGVSQTSVFRMEDSKHNNLRGPEVVLISLIAKKHKIDVPTEFPEEVKEAGE